MGWLISINLEVTIGISARGRSLPRGHSLSNGRIDAEKFSQKVKTAVHTLHESLWLSSGGIMAACATWCNRTDSVSTGIHEHMLPFGWMTTGFSPRMRNKVCGPHCPSSWKLSCVQISPPAASGTLLARAVT